MNALATTGLRRLTCIVILALVGAPGLLNAQETGRRCRNIELLENPAGTTRVQFTKQGEGYVTGIGGGAVFVCRAEGIRLAADSAERYEAAGIVYLFGRVRYTEGETSVNAERITYWQRDERILAERNVIARLGNGTTMTGPRADYLRAVPALRPRAQLRATERPHITLVQRDTTPAAGRAPSAPDTTVVDANTVFMDGDSLIYASGRVVVTRSDLVATSDSLALDRATERARFLGKPVMRGSGERSFTLTGSVIDIFSRQRKLERVLSRVSAQVESDEVRMTADTIDLRIVENKLDRAFAFGTKRARAVSAAQDVTADSIDILMPGQRIREVRAIGKAVALSEPDSTKITSSERDWIRGDTIIAMFDSIPAADTTSKARIRELRSILQASSFYQIPPDDSTSRCPSINYSRGHAITVVFDSQAVQRVAVTDVGKDVDGLHLECRAPVTDTTRAVGARVPGAPQPAPRPAPPPRTPATPPPTTGRVPE